MMLKINFGIHVTNVASNYSIVFSKMLKSPAIAYFCTSFCVLGIPENPRDRSPSPEPIYNSKGMRINTRLDRTKNKLVRQRNDAITKLKTLDPTYQPPSNFNYKNAQLEERVPIPAEVI